MKDEEISKKFFEGIELYLDAIKEKELDKTKKRVYACLLESFRLAMKEKSNEVMDTINILLNEIPKDLTEREKQDRVLDQVRTASIIYFISNIISTFIPEYIISQLRKFGKVDSLKSLLNDIITTEYWDEINICKLILPSVFDYFNRLRGVEKVDIINPEFVLRCVSEVLLDSDTIADNREEMKDLLMGIRNKL